ncbi:MAG: glycosyltransferase family 2 protein [Sediminibacterium sp.]|nr:glycosyltransferase family 2 protein [Sediminibacterium sp.]MBP6144950.1 glycosyltransferase family 2 protein [Sediminibacterium sp.]
MSQPNFPIQEAVQRTQQQGAKFSIIIPSWNNLPFLQKCVESIRKNSTHPHQIIVHVNQGKDGSYDWVKMQNDIDYTYSVENIGVCYALNAARTILHTPYLLYLNDDMYLCPGWDTALLDEIKSIGHDLFFLSSTVIEPIASSHAVIEKNYGQDIESFQEEKLLKEFAQWEQKDWSGATWPPNILPVALWDYVGGYSIEFSPGMYSDPDFSMKLWMAGVRYFKGVSKSRAYHFGSKSVKRVKRNKGYHQFIYKWGFTSSLLTKYMLHRGEDWQGPLPEFTMTTKLKWKNKLKQLLSAFSR